jgi:two-component system NtrC family sensor kinase
MRKFLLFTICLVLSGLFAAAQKMTTADSLAAVYKQTKQDTTLIQLLVEQSNKIFLDTNPDSGMVCLQKSLILSRKIHYKKGEVKTLASIANYSTRSGDLPGALRIAYETLPEAIQINEKETIIFCYNTLGLAYASLKDFKKSLYYFHKLEKFAENSSEIRFMLIGYNNISRDFLDTNNPDSALFYNQKAYDFCIRTHNTDQQVYPFLFRNFGIVKFEKGDYPSAIVYYKKSIRAIPAIGNHYLLSEDYRRIAETFQKTNRIDSGIYYSKKALVEAKAEKSTELILRTTDLLTHLYLSLNNYKEAFNNQQIMLKAKDSLFNQQKALQIQNLTFNEQLRQQELEADKIAYQDKVRFYTLLAALGVLLLIAFILLYNNQRKKKANVLLQQRNDQIESQRKALEQTLSELKTTQTQLIQSEKMASLGELTAGIAHEIQNPLNFVNNFSEVNTELIDEMHLEIDSANFDEAMEIAVDIKENQQKISYHGKRADFIVKGMLQHSLISTGERLQTDINVLADEFLKLSYHSLRSKDKTFNAELITNFDKNLPKINVVQQDIGRVLLNLFNNAFYAVNQKQKTVTKHSFGAGEAYKPEVLVTTKAENDHIIISVKDNGTGIPDAIKEKIMQPFFTTKPTGEGTGLGLSLAYDMVVKGHGGSIAVNSIEGKSSEFIITLPRI